MITGCNGWLQFFSAVTYVRTLNTMLEMAHHDSSTRDRFSVGKVSLRDVSLRQVYFVIFFAASQSRLFTLLRPIYW